MRARAVFRIGLSSLAVCGLVCIALLGTRLFFGFRADTFEAGATLGFRAVRLQPSVSDDSGPGEEGLLAPDANEEAWLAAAQADSADAPEPTPRGRLSSESRARLGRLRMRIRSWALACPMSPNDAAGGSLTFVAAKEDCEDGVGDAMLFNGILCLSGESFACDAVRASEDGDGRLWRAPSRIGRDAINSSSRDMFFGFLAYAAASGDHEALRRFENFEGTRLGFLCFPFTDSRCLLLPSHWALLKNVEGASLDRSEPETLLARLFDRHFVRTGLDDRVLRLHVTRGDAGYPLHLVAVQLLIRHELLRRRSATGLSAALTEAVSARRGSGGEVMGGEVRLNETRQKEARERESRRAEFRRLVGIGTSLAMREPHNPLFLYLGRASPESIAREILGKCPRQRPSRADQWFPEREDASEAWRRSMGWDCVALIDLLLRKPL